VAGLKEALPGVLWSGQFETRSAKVPLKQKLVRHSGILCADLDDIADRIPEIRTKLIDSPHVLAVFLSPTGSGLKALFRVQPHADQHLASFERVRKHVFELTGCPIDLACKDVTRLCFVSFDPQAFINGAATVIPMGGECTEETEGTEATDDTKETEVITPGAWVFQIRTLDDAIRRARPNKTHENNNCLFVLARGVKALEAQAGKFAPEQHREAFDRWCDAAKPNLRQGQSKEDYWMEYLNAYSRAKYPLGSPTLAEAWRLAQAQPLPPEAKQFDHPQRRLLVALCRQLQILKGSRPFYLSARTCATLFGHKNHTTAWTWLNALRVLRIIEVAEAGTALSATRFRYLYPLE
jgi:hypothetical protein